MSHPVPASPPAPKPRPSGWWFVVGVGLIVLAIAAAIALAIWTFSSFFHTDARVEADGQPHHVTVDTDRDRMVWLDETTVPVRCTVVDSATGEAITLRHVDGEFRRSNGTMGDWVGTYRFDPGSGHLVVTCGPTGAADWLMGVYVEIGPSPSFGGLAGGILLTMLVPGLLGLTGVAVLIVTGIFFATRPPRRKT